MNPDKRPFSFKTLFLIIFLTLLVGVGAYAVAWQFNDGKMGPKVVGSVFLGMSLPSLLMGGVLRLFRPDLQRYFALTGLTCLFIGLVIILS